MDTLREIDDPYPYFRGLICDLGYERAEIPYSQPARRRGITKNNFYTLYDLAMLGITNHSKVPLRLATMAGFTRPHPQREVIARRRDLNHANQDCEQEYPAAAVDHAFSLQKGISVTFVLEYSTCRYKTRIRFAQLAAVPIACLVLQCAVPTHYGRLMPNIEFESVAGRGNTR